MDERRAPAEWIRLVVIWGVTVLLVAFFYLLFMARNLEAITAIDALDYAQIARNIAEGKGYTTDFIKPLSLTRAPTLDQHPELVLPPLHPLLTSVFIRALGAGKNAVALASGLPFLATLLLTYFLGLRLFDRRVALLGTALFGANLWALNYSISGLEVCLLGLLFTGLVYVLYVLGQDARRRLPLALLAGALLGMLALTKEVWGLAVLPAALFVAYSVPREQRARLVGALLGGFVVLILPWAIRQAILTGNPFFTWRWYEICMTTLSNPGNTLYRSYTPTILSPLTFVFTHPMEMLYKMRVGAELLYGVLFAVGGPFTAAFFIVAILVPLGTPLLERMRYMLYGVYGLIFLTLLIVMPDQRAMYPLGPLMALIGAAFFLRVLTPVIRRYAPREQHRFTILGLGLLVLMQATPLLLNLGALRRPGQAAGPERVARLAEEVARLTSGPIITDVPWWTAWYGNQKSIWLPRSWDDVDRLQEDIGQVRYILLTPVVQQAEASERTQEWAQLWLAARVGQPVSYRGYVVYRVLPDNWVLLRKDPQRPSRETGPGGSGLGPPP